MSVYIDAAGIRDYELLTERFPEIVREAMSIALNDVARGPALKAARRNITEQVNYPDGYLDSRVTFRIPATPTKLEAVISGRDKATSLARFVPAGTRVSRGRNQHGATEGINVQVKPGKTERFKSGFLRTLSNGNIGFAIRLKLGKTVRNVRRYTPIQLKTRDGGPSGVFLLYGPSVDQVLTDVGEQINAEVTSDIAIEFNRQFVRLTRSA